MSGADGEGKALRLKALLASPQFRKAANAVMELALAQDVATYIILADEDGNTANVTFMADDFKDPRQDGSLLFNTLMAVLESSPESAWLEKVFSEAKEH